MSRFIVLEASRCPVSTVSVWLRSQHPPVLRGHRICRSGPDPLCQWHHHYFWSNFQSRWISLWLFFSEYNAAPSSVSFPYQGRPSRASELAIWVGPGKPGKSRHCAPSVRWTLIHISNAPHSAALVVVWPANTHVARLITLFASWGVSAKRRF